MANAELGSRPRPVDDIRLAAAAPGAPSGDRLNGRQVVAPALILLLPIIIVSFSFFPGHMSSDTLAQIGQARSGRFTNQHAPLLGALWHLAWPLGIRPGWILVVQVSVFVGGTYLVLRSFFSGWAAASLTAAIALSPPVFGMLGYLSRDTWFTALLIATFGLLVWSTRHDGTRSTLLLVAAFVMSWLALASRQNAIAAVAIADVAIAWRILVRRQRGGRLRRIAIVTSVGVGLTVAMFSSQLVVAKLIGVRNVNPEQYVFIYDLEMLSHDLGRNLFPPDVMARRGFAVIEQFYSIDSVNPLLFSPDPPVRTPLAQGPVRSLGRAWKSSVVEHPLNYLSGRFALWLRQISVTRAPDFIYHPVVDPNELGLKVRYVSLNDAAKDYVEAFANPRTLDGGPLHFVWVYLLVNIGGAFVFLRTRMRPAQRLVGLLGVAMVTHQSGLLFGAMGTQYRFEFPVVAVGAVMLTVLVQHRWRRNQPAGVETT